MVSFVLEFFLRWIYFRLIVNTGTVRALSSNGKLEIFSLIRI